MEDCQAFGEMDSRQGLLRIITGSPLPPGLRREGFTSGVGQHEAQEIARGRVAG